MTRVGATVAQTPTPVVSADPLRFAALAAGYAASAAAVVVVGAVVYRWYTRRELPEGLAFLLGLGTIAILLNTTAALGRVIGGTDVGLFDFSTMVSNLVVFGAAAAVTPLARRLGDRTATSVFAVANVREFEGEVGRIVRSVGRVTVVELPAAEEIAEMEAYDPVDPAVVTALGGKTLLFPSRLTVAELRDRLATRLKDDYGVGHVDVELAADGSVTYIALGSRPAGLGPTVTPDAAVVAVRADPAYGARAGDLVQVWRRGPDGTTERVATAELRAAVGDIVTLVVDETDAERFDATTRYRLVTLPVRSPVDREFATLLRAADETMGVVEAAGGSALVGTPLGDLDGTVVAVRPAEDAVETLPSRARAVAVGDTLYVVSRPEALRRLELAAAGET